MDDDDAIPKSEQTWLAELMTRDSGPMQSDVRMACRMLAHNKLGPIREERSLKEASAEYERIECEDVPAMRIDPKAHCSDKIRGEELESALSVRNLALLGRLLAFASLRRTESRGAHFRIDHPDTDDLRWRLVTRLQLGANNAIEFYTDPVKESVPSDVHG
jgi:succinate dehydrogenase/fumarate reductase flavoprotein subunit